MNEMVERIARAIMLADGHNNPENPPRFPTDFSAKEASEYRSAARAAIAAMREPTEAMLAASGRLNHPRDAEIWRAMIDAVLADDSRPAGE